MIRLIIHALCLEYLTGFEESMTYGGPCYRRAGVAEVSFASQKNNLALYILRKEVLDAHRDQFPPSTIGKGCIRYRNPNQIDFELVKQMLIETARSTGKVC